MKTRNGFVSNSSTSSFCIYGARIDANLIVDEKAIEKLGLSVYDSNPNYDHESVYIGRSWRNIKDSETGLQFKQGIEKILKEMFGIEKCSTIEEAWYDG